MIILHKETAVNFINVLSFYKDEKDLRSGYSEPYLIKFETINDSYVVFSFTNLKFRDDAFEYILDCFKIDDKVCLI